MTFAVIIMCAKTSFIFTPVVRPFHVKSALQYTL